MRHSLLNILAAIGIAATLSGCIIVPAHRSGGYGYVGGGPPPPPPGPVYHNGY